MKQKCTQLIFVMIFHATARFAFSQPCPVLTDFRNGIVVSNGIKAHYWCTRRNYRIVGPVIRTCEEGVWSEEEPYCAYSGLCPSLSHPVNGNVTVNTYKDGGRANYFCNSKYGVSGTASRICSTGVWSGSDSTCEVVCPNLSNTLGNGSVTVGSTFVGGVAQYSCNSGYRLSGSSARSCQASRIWSGVLPACIRLCPYLSHPINGRVTVNTYDDGGRATYTCNSGYGLSGSVLRTCSNGRWSEIDSTCEIVCSNLSNTLGNGRVTVISTFVGGVAQYSCNSGYRLFGSSARSCQASRIWSGVLPICIRLCPSLSHPINGRVTVNTYDDGGRATYTCNSGYEVSGSVSRTCSNGRWSGIVSNCERIVCPQLFKPGNGQVSVMSKSIGGRAIYSCDQNYNLIGSPQQVCQQSGVWSEFPPICTRLGPEVRVDATAEIQIGFEQLNIDVPEGAGTIDICVSVLHTITSSVDIPRITLELSALDYGDAVLPEDFTQVPINFRHLVLSGTHQRVCYPQEIMDDNIPENDEEFSLILRLISRDSVSASVSLLPSVVVVRILNDDGLATVGFEESTIGIKEDIEYGSVCVRSRFNMGTKDMDTFTLLVNSYPATADAGIDYQNVDSVRIGPFTSLSPQYCFQVNIIADSVIEPKETFILKLSLETYQTDVIIEPTLDTLIVQIIDDDESTSPGLVPCDSYLRVFFPEWFKHCCTYPIEWSTWTDKPNGNIAMPKSLCSSGEGSIKVRLKTAPEEGCDPKVEYEHYCNPTQTEQLIQTLGLGSQLTVYPATTGAVPTASANTPIQGRRKRSSPNHCYDRADSKVLSTTECKTKDMCPHHESVASRKKMNCQNRAILFIIDSSGSIGNETFSGKFIQSVATIGRITCGDTKFALLKFSTKTYLEFCFDCYDHSHNGRESLVKRVLQTAYAGRLTHTGAAVSCAGNFMLKEACGFNISENRCIDIVIFTDGQSNGKYDVCKQIECLHKNLHLAPFLKIHVIGVGNGISEELSCIRRYTTTQYDGGDSFFKFKTLDDLDTSLDIARKLIFFELGKAVNKTLRYEPKYDCVSWINGTEDEYQKNFVLFP